MANIDYGAVEEELQMAVDHVNRAISCFNNKGTGEHMELYELNTRLEFLANQFQEKGVSDDNKR